MTEPKIGVPSLAFVEKWVEEDDSLQMARRNAAELGTCVPIGSGTGAALRFLAAAIAAKAVVEVGTGAGTSGIWLLRGMRPDGVLTTVDIEGEHQRLAKQAYAAAGIAPNRYRLINGQAADVLPRLTDGGYDLVFVDADKTGYVDYLTQALRLLRPGGVVAFDNALRGDQVADATVRDVATVTVRELVRAVHDNERLVPALLPVGDGLLVAVTQ
jgi:predicted O-methyltransferase YrrM